MGFGDLFVAAARRLPRSPPIGRAIRLARPDRQLGAAALVAVLALAFDLLFFAVDTLPATVPVAVALALIERRERAADAAAARTLSCSRPTS